MEILNKIANVFSTTSIKFLAASLYGIIFFFNLSCSDDINPLSSNDIPATLSDALTAGYYENNHICLDNNGNKFVVQYFGYKQKYSVVHNSDALSGQHLSKYDPDGNLLWQIFFWRATVADIVVDYVGDCIVAGTFHGTAYFENEELSSNGSWDIFYAKYSPDGNLIWLKQAGSDERDHIDALAVDTNGDLYITGRFSNLPVAESPTMRTKTLNL